MPGLKTLLFVYNTDSSVLQAIKDYSAGTSAASRAEDCTLCSVTHSPVGMKKEWKRFLRNLEIPSRFLNRNEFFSEFGPSPIAFPVVPSPERNGDGSPHRCRRTQPVQDPQ